MPDDLSQQVKKETIASDWIGDPRRFKAIKYVKVTVNFTLFGRIRIVLRRAVLNSIIVPLAGRVVNASLSDMPNVAIALSEFLRRIFFNSYRLIKDSLRSQRAGLMEFHNVSP